MTRGPGGHVPDGSGPYGRGAGPGKGTGTAKAYKDADKTEPAKDTGKAAGLEGKVAGPGGNVPDGTGSKGRGLGAGPGDGREDGTGLYSQEEFKKIYDSNSESKARIDSYVSQYFSEADALELTGNAKQTYVLRKLKAKLKEDKTSSKAKKEGADSKKGSGDNLERRVSSSDYSKLQKEYGSIYSEYSDAEIDSYVAEYHNEAFKKEYTGKERRAYVKEKIKGKMKGKKKAKPAKPKKVSKSKAA